MQATRRIPFAFCKFYLTSRNLTRLNTLCGVLMDYDKLENAYWLSQVRRVESLRRKINDLTVATAGRVVPEDEDLAIGTGKRLSMAIMFLDISGFSGRPSESALEQADLLRVLNLYFTEMIKIAEDYGGTVEKNTGDGLMAYFEDNGGSPPEGGSKRALACALTMMDTGSYLINPILVASNIPEIKFRIAIDYGAVTVARIGPPKRFNAIVAVGATANITCKMLAYAQPGDIILGESAFKKLPVLWQLQWTQLLATNTGWVYRLTQQPYPFYRYAGRWNGPK